MKKQNWLIVSFFFSFSRFLAGQLNQFRTFLRQWLEDVATHQSLAIVICLSLKDWEKMSNFYSPLLLTMKMWKNFSQHKPSTRSFSMFSNSPMSNKNLMNSHLRPCEIEIIFWRIFFSNFLLYFLNIFLELPLFQFLTGYFFFFFFSLFFLNIFKQFFKK